LYIGWLSVTQWRGVQWIVKVYVEVTGGHIGPVDGIGCFDRRHTCCAWQINIVYLLKYICR
jgi:hypothetical protein